MKFYSYKGIAPLGQEPLGTSSRRLDELKTVQGVVNRNIKRGIRTSKRRYSELDLIIYHIHEAFYQLIVTIPISLLIIFILK